MFVNATNGYDIYCQNTNETLHLINRKYKDGKVINTNSYSRIMIKSKVLKFNTLLFIFYML